MRGTTHGVSALPPWLLVAPVVADEPWQVAAGMVVAYGSAFAPDIDHHASTATRAFGPFAGLVWRATRAVFGGHREGTHSYACAVAAGVVAGLVGFVPVFAAGWVPWVAVAVTVGWLAHILGDRLTPQPVAVHWPFDKRRKPFPVTLTSTGGWRETVLATALGIVAVALAGRYVTDVYPAAGAVLGAG